MTIVILFEEILVATSIHVLNGPDAGMSFAIQSGRTIRIGASARCAVCLNDTRIAGELEVLSKDDIYRVTNNLETAVYLGTEVLRPGESSIWYVDAILQPSAVTRMALRLDNNAAYVFETDEPVKILTDVGGAAIRGRIAYAIVAVLFVVAVVLLISLRTPTIDGRVTALRNTAEKLQTQLNLLSSVDVSLADRTSFDRVVSLISQAEIAARRRDQSLEERHYWQLRTEIQNLQNRLQEVSETEKPALENLTAELSRVEQSLNVRIIQMNSRL